MSSSNYQSHKGIKKHFPIAAYEVTLLEYAGEVAKRKEEAHFQRLNQAFNWDISLQQRNAYLKSMQLGFTLILTDVSNTILWTSYNFLSMTGYGPKEVIGRTPKMLQGPGTDPLTTRRIGNYIREEKAVQADLVNYRKSGQLYTCHLEISPLRNEQGELTHFLAEAIEKMN